MKKFIEKNSNHQNNSLYQDIIFVIIVFLLAGLIRAIPEIKAGYWPIGYDTLSAYLPELVQFKGQFLTWILSSNLLYIIFWFFQKTFSLDPVILIKVGGSVIYGGLAVSFYLFCRKYLKWSTYLSLLAGILLIIQVASLRMSWDLFRNMLSLIFLFPALYLLEYGRKYSLIILAVLGVLIVLSNPLAAGFWIVMVVIWLLYLILRKKYHEAGMIFLSIIPSFIMFFLRGLAPTSDMNKQIIWVNESSDRIFNYFEYYLNKNSYQELKNNIFNLFWLYYKWLLPFAVFGFWLLRKKPILTIFTLWLIFGSFGSLILRGYGLFVWDRWMLMLVFPFTIYTIYGLKIIIEKILSVFNHKYHILIKAFAILFLIIYFGLILKEVCPFLTRPYKEAQAPFKDDKLNVFIPRTMVHSAVGFDGIEDILKCIGYLDKNMPQGSALIADSRYRGLIINQLDTDQYKIYMYPWSPKVSRSLVDEIKTKKENPIYVIYSSQAKVARFDRVFSSGLFSIYREKESYQNYIKSIPK